MTLSTKMDVAGRADRLAAKLAEEGCDALLVTNLIDIRYLTGFTGSAGLLLVLPDEMVFVSDGRYRDQAEEQVTAAGVAARVETAAALSGQHEILEKAASGVARLGLQASHVAWSTVRHYRNSVFPGTELVATSGLIESLRQVKDEGELERLAEAARIADAALEELRPRLAERLTETDFALELEVAMRRLGASAPSFESIVASGPNGAKPHARPTRRRIVEGDLVVLDFGALVDGYHSDMTRTVMVGSPSPTQARMLEVVADSQAAGVAAVGPGVACREVDRVCRDVISEAGWADAFLHGTGHGVGLDIHEDPRVFRDSSATLAEGHVVTVEPGVYLPDHGGVRIEDTVVVTSDGCRALTHASKESVLL